MVQVVWSRTALANLEATRAYISQFNPVAGQRMALRLKRAAESLGQHPERGRDAGRGLRELVVIYPYLIRYRARPDGVFIVRIRHGAQAPD